MSEHERLVLRAVRPPSVAAAVLAGGAALMIAWESAPIPGLHSLRVGRACLLIAAFALAIELRSPTRLWHLARGLLRGPGLIAAVAAASVVTLIFVSVHTNGCQCSGGSYGVYEVVAWSSLVALVVAARPTAAPALLAAVTLGCVVAAISGVFGGTTSSTDARLVGIYGNANFLSITIALGFPAALAAFALAGGRLRLLLLPAIVVMATVGFLAYSRSGLIAAVAGGVVTIVLLAPPRRRVALSLASAAALGVASITLYPAYMSLRTQADFAGARPPVDARVSHASLDGLIPYGRAELLNVRPGVLRITASAPREGGSIGFGAVRKSASYQLSFSLRSSTPGLAVRYGLADAYAVAASVASSAAAEPRWRRLTLRWHPDANGPDGRAYFWATAPGAFELRDIAIASSTPAAAPRGLSTSLLDHRSLQAAEAVAERAYVNARLGALRLAIDAFRSNPLRGIGWERFETYSSTRSGVGAIATHDEYARYAAELGAPGFLALVALCASIAWAAVAVRRDSLAPALLGVLVAAGIGLAFINMLETPDTVLPAATAAGIVIALAAGCSERASRSR